MEVMEMEPTNKRRVHNPQDNTKLEDLPMHLIHHIMHFLPYQDAAKFSVLSEDFYSYWLSFPILHFKCRFFQLKDDSYPTFLDFIRKTLQLRGPYIKGSLQKLSLSYEEVARFNPYPYRTVFDVLLIFALQNNCKEIDLDLRILVSNRFFEGMKDIVNVSHGSLFPLFSSQFLTVLSLTGVKIPIADTFIACPNLEELLLHYCQGFQTITVSSSSLREVDVKCCKGLKAFQLEGKSLYSFKFEGIRTNHELHPCDTNLLACDSLRSLHLTNVKVSDNIIKVVIVTEFLYIDRCDMPRNLRIRSPQIKVLEMNRNYNLENLVLSTPNLECFMYEASEVECTLDISACLALTVLKVIDERTISGDWLRRTISVLGCLKELKIGNCIGLEKVEFKNGNLEKFFLCGCSNVKEVNIDTRNLIEFYYNGSLEVYPLLILSTKCNGNILLPHDIQLNQILWFEKMTRFLHCFDHFNDLTLSCIKAEDMIFPRRFVWPNKLSPLYDLKHVALQTYMRFPSGQTVIPLVESLLWLVPKPFTLTLSSPYTAPSTLKFVYGKKAKTTKVEDCCHDIPIKCWRHYDLKIEFHGFNESSRQYLEKFFAPYLCL